MPKGPTLHVYDDAGTPVATVAVERRPRGGAAIAVPAKGIDPKRAYSFAFVEADGRRFLYRAGGPPRIAGKQALFTLRLDIVGSAPLPRAKPYPGRR